MNEGRLSNWRLLLYAGPAVPIAALGVPISVFLPQFYAGEMGLGLATVGTIFLICRLWDVVTDPVMGFLSDKYPSRWGRRRHWIALSVPILMLSAYMVFLPSKPVTPYYLAGWMIFLYIGWTMLTISHMSWGAELDRDYNERSRIQGFREGAQIAGVPIVLVLVALVQIYLSTPDTVDADRVNAIGWFVIVMLPIAVFFAVTITPERNIKLPGVLSVKQMLEPLLRNAPLRRVTAADFASGVSGASLGSLFVYIVEYDWRLKEYIPLLLLLYFTAGVLFVPVVVRLARALGKHRAAVASGTFNACLVPLVFLIPDGNIWIAGGMLFFLGVNAGAMNLLYRSIMADIGDLDEIETGERRTGLFYSLLTLTQKTGAAIAVGVVFWLLALVGFDPQGDNPPEVVNRLSYIFVGIPMLANASVAFLMWGFPIDEKKQKEMRKILEERYLEEVESAQRPIP